MPIKLTSLNAKAIEFLVEERENLLTELMAETRDMLFQSDNVYLRHVFLRDANGIVTGFIDRSETDGRSWDRVRSD